MVQGLLRVNLWGTDYVFRINFDKEITDDMLYIAYTNGFYSEYKVGVQ